jgi:hypothetical protein
MCATSAIYDYGMTRVPLDQWTRPAFNEFQEIIRRLEKLDEMLAQPDCEDPGKAEWMRAVEKRLDALEGVSVS